MTAGNQDADRKDTPYAASIARHVDGWLVEIFQKLECVTRVSRTRYASLMRSTCRQPSVALNAGN